MLKRRFWRRLGLAVPAVLGSPLVFGASNLFLASPKGRGFFKPHTAAETVLLR
jgi:hypothetical protein